MALEELGSFINQVGFPIAAFLLMLLLYRDLVKRADKKQEEGDERYEMLVKTFISTIENISETQTKALQELGTKLERHMQQKDDYMKFINENIRKR